MTENPIIFRHSEVYSTVIENLFCSVSENCQNKECEGWFLAPPRFTTVRINSLVSSAQEVEGVIRKSLDVEAARRGWEVPEMGAHPGLPELLVLEPWAPPPDLPQPRPSQEVIVDAACGAAVLRGANVFAPGVLAVPAGTQEGTEVSLYADTAGLCRRGLSVIFNNPDKAYLGIGVMRMSRKQLFQNDLHPKGIAVEVTMPVSNVSSVAIPPHLGLLQNLPSVVCGRVVDACPNDTVIDLCAAPGHKTTHLASLMQNQGILVALDKTARKVEGLQSLCKAMGADCVRAFSYDATKAVSHEATDDWAPPFSPSTFDKVLLDAPCSALGQRPQFGNCLTRKQIASHPRLQKKLFDAAVQLVKPGGSLVYSTCSVTLEENEDIVRWALDRYPQIELVPAVPLIGRPASLKSSLSESQRNMVQRFGPPIEPSPDRDTIGFFIAKFTKRS